MTNKRLTTKGINLDSAQLTMQEALARLEHDRDLHLDLLKQSGKALVIGWPGSADGSFDADRDGHYKVVTHKNLFDHKLNELLAEWDNRKTGYNYRASILVYQIGWNGRLLGVGGYTPMLSTAYIQFYSPIDGQHIVTNWINLPAWAEPVDAEVMAQKREDMKLFKTFARYHRPHLPEIHLPRDLWP